MIKTLKIMINNFKRRSHRQIKERIQEKNEIKLFKSYTVTFNFIDGSNVTTDPIDFKKFKTIVANDIRGFQFREPVEDDYKIYFDNILYLLENVNEANVFEAVIKGKVFKLEPSKITSAIPNIEK